ncbi:16S rRNA (cytosine(967)-C(5))-methyltransferase RsmB [Thermodesulfobacteriota bacterium]
MADNARKTALSVLNTLDKGHRILDSVLDDVLGKDPSFSPRDKGLIYALVYGVLRWRGNLDWIIGHFSKTPLNRIDPGVLNILRIGLFQIKFLSRIPVSAAINTSVEMTKSFAAPWVVGYVNATLRSAAKGYQTVPFPELSEDPVIAIASKKSFPKWLIARWVSRLGIEETLALCDAINTIPPITIRTNSLKSARKKLIKSLEFDAKHIEKTNYSSTGISFSNPKRPISEIKAFEEGWFQVQDEAAQLVTLLLNPQPGETVLDACAGLGGKTGHIAQMMENHGRLVAMDKDEKKLQRLEVEMTRLGVSIVSILPHDLNYPLSGNRVEMFDRILLDAPCSGLGVLRRNPDTKWSMSKKKLSYHKEKQAKFMENLMHLVKPSGVLVYAVCSTEPEENMAVVKDFLNKHSEFAIEKGGMGLPSNANHLIDQDGFLRTFPHLHSMDGFFSVCLKRTK